MWSRFLKKRPEMTYEDGSRLPKPRKPIKSCKSKNPYLHVRFKNTCEIAQAVKGMHIQKPPKCLNDVTLKEQCVSFLLYEGVCGCALTKQWRRQSVYGPQRGFESRLSNY